MVMLNFSIRKKTPEYRQAEVSECGLVCIAMIASYHGYQVDPITMRQMAPVGTKGMTLNDIISVAEKMNLSGRGYKCDMDELSQLRLPAILHWDMNHFVVLTKVTGKHVVIHDPARGRRVLSYKNVSDNYTGIALELMPTADFKQGDVSTTPTLSMLWSKMTGLKRTVLKLIGLSLLVQAVVLLMPYYQKFIIDDVLIAGNKELLVVLAFGFGMLVIFDVIARFLRGWLSLRMSSMMGMQIGVNVMGHLLKLPMQFFESRHTGDIYSRFNSSRTIRDTLSRGLSEAIIDGFMSIILIIVMFCYSWELGIGVAVVASAYVFFRVIFQKYYRKNTEEALVSSANEQSYFMESLHGMQTLKLYNFDAERLAAWSNRFVSVINAEICIGRLKLSFEMLNKILFGIENIVIIYFASLFVIDGEFTIGTLLAFLAYKRHFTESFVKFVDNIIEINLLKLHVERISDITFQSKEDLGVKVSLIDVNDESRPSDIVLEDVAFRFTENSPFLFENLNLTIKAGESVAITGSSGEGKTTLLKIIVGLIAPTKGRILYGGKDIRAIGIGNYRKCVASIMQDDALFSGTLKENIALFNDCVDLDKVKMSAYRALMHNDITAMPMGYETLVGDMGSVLSGGQKQRIMIARALYRDAPVLAMDEATSHLDVENEKRIVAFLSTLKKTRIIIAHRQESIDMADRVVNLNGGKIYEVS